MGDLIYHVAYHGSLRVQDAEMRLQEKGGICFLFYYCKDSKSYRLSVVDSNGQVQHILLKVNPHVPAYSLEFYKKFFPSLTELIAYYQSNVFTPTIKRLGEPCYPLHKKWWCPVL